MEPFDTHRERDKSPKSSHSEASHSTSSKIKMFVVKLSAAVRFRIPHLGAKEAFLMLLKGHKIYDQQNRELRSQR